MLRTYKYIETDLQKLHDNIMAFFDRIEFETGDFSTNFFDSDFYDKIAKHHKKILVIPLEKLYTEIRKWSQENRSSFIQKIRESNDIENICKRNKEPLSIDNIPDSIKNIKIKIKKKEILVVQKLSNDLYNQVLQGEYMSNLYGSLQSHFEKLRESPNDFLKCPACGLENLKTGAECRNQYDHYLHKSKYIFSSINFKNLVPICTECNSYDVKHDRDILNENNIRRIFYPYDETHQKININVNVINDNGDLNNLDFNFSYSTIDNRNEEIDSWKTIFKIDSRYKARAKGAGIKWYNHFLLFKYKPKYKGIPEKELIETYFECQDEETIEIIMVPVLKAFNNSILTKAKMEADHFAKLF